MPTGYGHHRQSFDFFETIVAGEINVTSTAARVKVDAEELERRKVVAVINDSSTLVFVNDKDTFDASAGDAITVLSGEEFEFHMNPQDNKRLWVKTDELNTKIRVFEVR